MKAAIYKEYGPPEVLNIEEVEKPSIQADEDDMVLIKVDSGSINPADVLPRKGYIYARPRTGWLKPKDHNTGTDVAGTVEAVSNNVNRFKIGDRVFGGAVGAHAEYARARQKNLSLIPKNASFEEASALPIAAITALQALRDVAEIKAGQKVLIYGASGGVGHFAVQLARYYDTEVTAVTSTTNQEWVKALGAHHMIDYTQEDFVKNGEKYDVILDAVGKRTFFGCSPSLTENGVYISEHPIRPLYNLFQILLSPYMGSKRGKMHLAHFNEKDLELLRDLMQEEKLKPVIEKVYPLEQIVEAHRHAENGHTKGKVVVKVQDV